jgi:hypothetical protein
MIIAFVVAVVETRRLSVAVYTRAVSADSRRNVGRHPALPVRASAPLRRSSER